MKLKKASNKELNIWHITVGLPTKQTFDSSGKTVLEGHCLPV